MSKLEIGPYSRTAIPSIAYYLIDEYGMRINRLPPNHNRGDSLAGNMVAFFNYDDVLLPQTSANLWYWDSDGDYVGQRHPLLSPHSHPMSRDHYTSTLVTLKLFNLSHDTTLYDSKIKEITDNTGYIISSMARRTLGLKWWSKAIQGKRFYEFLFYIFELVTVMFIYLPIHRLGSWIANYGEEVDQSEWVETKLQDQPKYKQWIDKIIYPSYALLLSGWQLYVLKDSFLKKILQRLYRLMVGKTNYVQQMLYGKKGIPREKIMFFQPMQGGRWSGYLSSRNDRSRMRVLDSEPTYNNMDVDLVRRLYNETQL